MVMSPGTGGGSRYRVSLVAEMCAVLTFDSQKELLFLVIRVTLDCISSASVALNFLAFVCGKAVQSWQDLV